jgi:hypothetical protein
MPGARIVRRFAVDFLRIFLLLFCLFAPSAWMIATIPPLWRDTDAYIQTTENPLVATVWGHAPAYCYAAKIPLFAGEQLDRLRGNPPANRRIESSQPSLTDSGIWLLIIGQHLALCGAAFYFITAVSHFFWVRLMLALLWTSNPLFYTFAHCVGSETLGMIFTVLLVGKALCLVRSRGEPSWIDWYVFALALCFCLLSRHLNLGLISLLPAAFLLSWAQTKASRLFASSDRRRLRLRYLATRHLRHAVIATAIGIACFAVASALPHELARKTRFHPHSRIGFIFLWRLHFLQDISPESRRALLQKVAARTHSTDVRKLIALMEQMHAEGVDLADWQPFMKRAIELFGGSHHWEDLDRALNQMAFVFLWPPTPEHLHVARTEIATALQMPVTVISFSLFETTAYYFQHKEYMPACAELVTFRNYNADQIRQLPSQHLYFRLWRSLDYNEVLVIWLVSLLIFAVLARRKQVSVGGVTAFGIALPAVGLALFALTSLIHDYEPRFSLLMWQLLLLSLYIFVGKTADLLLTAGPQQPARPAIGSKQSAGQLPKLG